MERDFMSEDSNWSDDKLGREQVANYLTKFLLDAYNQNKKHESLVISLNAPWGFGKTFFIERWKKDIKSQKYPVIYFDAWRTDFSNQPLLTFILEN
jgi:predicted KAP-like P-loop ATPase